VKIGGTHMLTLLPPEEFERLRPALQAVDLDIGQVLIWPNQPITNVHLPRNCVISQVALGKQGQEVETGVIGREGVSGLPLVLGVETEPFRSVCQVPGGAWRLRSGDFRQAAQPGTTLHERLLRFAQAKTVMAYQGALCHRLHTVDQRCARWMLLVHDRVDGDEFRLTHEYLAVMLAAHRPTVTVALGILQRAGVLEYDRGQMHILDRPGLERASCECYAIIATEYERLLGVPTKWVALAG
jgi:CRP-like cAMP-binding protein